MVGFSPTEGHEQAGDRPALIVSNDELNNSRSERVTVIPITSTIKGLPMHVAIAGGTAGLDRSGVVLCDQVRTVSTNRLRRKVGTLPAKLMLEVEDRLKIHLDLP
jgi:mRNA interferase MazF